MVKYLRDGGSSAPQWMYKCVCYEWESDSTPAEATLLSLRFFKGARLCFLMVSWARPFNLEALVPIHTSADYSTKFSLIFKEYQARQVPPFSFFVFCTPRNFAFYWPALLGNKATHVIAFLSILAPSCQPHASRPMYRPVTYNGGRSSFSLLYPIHCSFLCCSEVKGVTLVNLWSEQPSILGAVCFLPLLS